MCHLSLYQEWDISPCKILHRVVKYFVKLLVKYTGGNSSVDIANMRQLGQSADGIPVGLRFSTPVQTELGANQAFCTIGNESLNRG